MKQNSLSPLEELRQEKELVRLEVAESEERLAEHWSYLKDNTGSLLFHSTVSSIAHKLGFGSFFAPKEQEQEQNGFASTGSVFQNVWSGLMAYYPLIWEMAQPMLLRFVVKKIKSIFSGKKKKRKDDDD